MAIAHINFFQVGSVFFGDGSSYNDTLCDNLDSGDYEEQQEYVQKVIETL